MANLPLLQRLRGDRRWSIARRLFWISLSLTLLQSLVSTMVTSRLRHHFMHGYLRTTLAREIVHSYARVSDRLDRLSVQQAFDCCSLQNYRSWLSGLEFAQGKAAVIVGSAGLQSSVGASLYYNDARLNLYAAQAINSPAGFMVDEADARRAVAVQAVKLPGGEETGYYVYIRPIYIMPVVRALVWIKLWSELVLMLLLVLAFLVSLRIIFNPVRQIQAELSEVELNRLDVASLSTLDRPQEFQPILMEFNRMVERLNVAALNQKQFASTISHEFRTPMTVISGFIQTVLNREPQLKPQFREALTVANREVLRLNRMLSDLLDLSRADNNQLRILRQPFDVIASCQDALRLAREAYANPLEAEFESTESLWAVGDADRMVQCLGNLIGNAVKYSPENSEIRLLVRRQPDGVAVSVRDQGQGIAEDQLGLIFERFQRAAGVVLRRGESSSGLGLSIVKMLVQGMGGSISVSSTVGEGSCFTICLPLAQAPSS